MKNSFKRTLLFFGLLSIPAILAGQSLEPRLYSNIPKDMNFLVVGYTNSRGALAENANLGIENPKLNVNGAFLAYARGLDIYGKSGKIDFVIPFACIDGTGKVSGEDVKRNVCGLADVKARISYNFFGAPSLDIKNFASYRQDLVIGTSLQVTIPTGQYDASKLVNISAHRWAIKPGIGISKSIQNFLLEFSADAEFYSQNSEFYGDVKRQQEAVYSTQAHLIYNFNRGVWLGLDTNYYFGGENINNDIKANDELHNSRMGVTFSFPVNRQNSVKIFSHTGISTRTGTDYTMYGFAWQYSFFE